MPGLRPWSLRFSVAPACALSSVWLELSPDGGILWEVLRARLLSLVNWLELFQHQWGPLKVLREKQ